MNIYDVIKKPLITEKTTVEKDDKNVIAFVVNGAANKIEIKAAVEQLFNAQVAAVNTVNVAGKTKRTARGIGKRSNWKKAYVTLKEGSNVDFFEA
ncbi:MULTISPECIES: 50S ribosomal protein L23 [Geomonas]|uniref:Large ribosomal subunit protein uL23 n=2 Tax=Geomonas TaxID=2651583 RepID=A0A6V8N2L0_9BACT|nr:MULTISPECIES: 50S ribosomal protein L23 [Geomonas]MBU5615495.1 50S ribosomal protein L23 [Geomonas azotofigens]QXE90770.1 50S ribosomal protein L23 [Geomonas subterranea]QXM11148.1 50S ribosomal protein L23 [Geomonas subterranea]UPU36958.1 50S ribosomal protein L23 [Geomonas paludis]GFO66204.1 50S ribosomal protein L23 [Geomonas paludis]